MAVSQVGIIYSTALRTIRRVIIPDFDSQLNDTKITTQGESLYKMPLADYNAAGGLDGLKAALAGQVGPAGNDLCALCNGQDQVQGVFRMDTAIAADVARSIPNGWYYVQGIPAQVQTGTYVDDLGATQPIMQTIAPGWFYNKTNGKFGLTKNPQ